MKKPICKYCKSDQVVSDGPLTWDMKEQKWVSDGSIYDDPYCCECSGETKLEWKEVNDNDDTSN